MYYPKSQITPNLYTNGNEYIILSNRSNYVGYYFTTSDNKIFSGRNPNDKPNFELVLNEGNNSLDSAEFGIESSYTRDTNIKLYPFAYSANTKLDSSTEPPPDRD